MDDFSFSELGRLYAENFAVVRAAENAYREDVGKCLGKLMARIGSLVEPRAFNSKKPTKYWYWWLGEDSKVAYLWFGDDPDFLSPTRIILYAGTGMKDDSRFEAIRRLIDNRSLGLKDVEGPTRDQIFEIEVGFAGSNFIESAAQKIAAVLRAMHDAVTEVAAKEATGS